MKVLLPKRRLFRLLLAAIWIGAGLPISYLLQGEVVFGAAYRCFDESGDVVLTDSPAQLTNCTVIQDKPVSGSEPRSRARSVRSPRTRPPAPPIVAPSEPSSVTDAELNDELDGPLAEKKDKTDGGKPDQSVEPITVRLTKIGGSYVVQARLNGSRDVHLIVDTGATMTVLSYDVATELGLLSGSGNSINTVNTAGGSVQVSMTRLENLRVGSAEATNVAVAVHDLPDSISGISGLLGMSFLKNFLVTLDSERALLFLLPRK